MRKTASIILAFIMLFAFSLGSFAATDKDKQIIASLESTQMWDSGITFAFERGKPIKKLDLSKYTTMEQYGKLIVSYLEKGDATSAAKIIADPVFIKVYDNYNKKMKASTGTTYSSFFYNGATGKQLWLFNEINDQRVRIMLNYSKMQFMLPAKDWPRDIYNRHWEETKEVGLITGPPIWPKGPTTRSDFLLYPDSVFTNTPIQGTLPNLFGDGIIMTYDLSQSFASIKCETFKDAWRFNTNEARNARVKDYVLKNYHFTNASGKVKDGNAFWKSNGNWRSKSGLYKDNRKWELVTPAPNNMIKGQWSGIGGNDFILDEKYGVSYQFFVGLLNDNDKTMAVEVQKITPDTKAWYDQAKNKFQIIKQGTVPLTQR